MHQTIIKRNCSFPPDISKSTVKAMLQDTEQEDWINKLNDDDWDIVSFDPSHRVVCIVLNGGPVTNYVNVTLPELS